MPKAGAYYRVKVAGPAQKTFGHGEPLKSFTANVNGQPYEFADGLVVKSSNQCDPENGVASLDADPPLVRGAFIEQYPDLFEPIESPDED